MEGKVPTANGDIAVYMNKKEIRVNAAVGTGKLRIKSKSKPVANGAEIKSIGNNLYEITVEKGRDYSVRYNY
jgi:hypothetical protein